MKSLFLFFLAFLFINIAKAQSIEFSPSGPVNLKIGNYYSPLSPISPENKLLIYSRESGNSGLTMVDSAADGTTNISQIFSKAGGAPFQGLFFGNYSNSPLVFFNNDEINNLIITPSGKIGIGIDKYGIDNSQKLYGKFFVNGIGDSLYSFLDQMPGHVGMFSNLEGSTNSNTLRIGIGSQTDGTGNAADNVTNIGIFSEASKVDTSNANGIGLHSQSFTKTEGYSIGVFAKSKNLGTGSSFGLNVEAYSGNGTTKGLNSTANGAFLNYGVYSNVIPTSGSPSPSYGYYANILNAANNNAIYAYYADVSKTSGNSTAYGSYLKINGSSGVNAIGSYQRVSSAGNSSFGTFANAIGSGENYGLYGFADGGSINYAVYGSLGEAAGSSDFAGYFAGNVHVAGVLSKSSGTFKIDHPLDPENKTLSHSFVESPEMMNIYNGNIVTDQNGNATIQLPSYFEALNENFRYQLTAIGQFAQAIVSEKIKGNIFKIKTDKPNVEISWMVTGTRKDTFAKQNPIIVEEEKTSKNKGKYLNPKSFGKTKKEGMFEVDAID
ncbi:hypothetical protein EGI22_13310 [Lacihabitans sp. LS3-19]|uniref:hypothetical protein n=1 Tax=Lacihabitans sp. LS3-19 TaxID=2487335 RepID=UPI0020CD5F1D|nr:hypothetical protein [Lacihabitans sp. LS3-19]MCP9768894.1 hypothetical protein [Lacihabitans sp. LS3-19]